MPIVKPPKPGGHTLRHDTDRNSCRVVPIMEMVIDSSGKGARPHENICNLCKIHHPVKCLHLWLGPTGEVMVSDGVLTVLKNRKLGMDGFSVVGFAKKPPPLRVGDGKQFVRAVVDNENRKQTIYGSELKGVSTDA